MSPKEFHHYEPSDYPSYPEGQHDWHGQGHAPRAELGPKGGYPEGGGAWSHWPPRGEEPGGYAYPGAEESGRDFESTGGYSLGSGGESSGRNQGGAFQQHGHTGHTARAGQGPGWHPGGFGGAPGSAPPHLNLSHEVGAPQSQAAGPHAGRGPKGYRRSDERIHEEICDRLTAHGAIDAGEIEVRVSSGEVTLEGPVENRRIKHLVELVCDEVPGVSDVHNHLKLVKK